MFLRFILVVILININGMTIANTIECDLTKQIDFVGVDFAWPYNGILGKSMNIRQFFNEQDAANRIQVSEVIKEKGVVSYLEGVVSGTYPGTFSLFNFNANALDIAKLWNVSPKLINEISASGYRLSNYYWVTKLKSNKGSIKLLQEYLTYENDINTFYVVVGNKRLSFGNYALMQKNIDLFRAFLLHGGDPLVGDLVNIEHYDIEERLKLAGLINLEEYVNKYKLQTLVLRNKPDTHSDFVFSEVCEPLVEWTLPSQMIDHEISKAKLKCKDNYLNCLNETNPLLAEIAIRRDRKQKLQDFDIKAITKETELETFDKNTLYYVEEKGLLYVELLIETQTLHRHIDKIRKVTQKSNLYRLEQVSFLIADNYQLTKYLQQYMPEIFEEIYLGKNLAHYVFLNASKDEYLKWFFKDVSRPKTKLGVSLLFKNRVKSIVDAGAHHKQSLFKKLGYTMSSLDKSAIKNRNLRNKEVLSHESVY